MIIRPVGAELLHAEGRAEGQTDMIKPVVTFINFTKAPKSLMSIQNKNSVCMLE
jgi:hypothetical protein